MHHVLQAQASGGEVRAREQVLEWQAEQGSVTVRTNRATYTAERLIFTAGAWSQSLLSLLGENAVPERQVMGWFQPAQPDLFAVERFPVFTRSRRKDTSTVFPSMGCLGSRLGSSTILREQTAPDDVDRECHPADEEALRSFTQQYLTGGKGATMALKTCMFTNTPTATSSWTTIRSIRMW